MKNKLSVIVLLLTCKIALSASFNCELAKTSVEKMICLSNNLSILDKDMAARYSSLTKIYTDSKAIRSWQRNWLRERNYCKDIECLDDSYKQRISLLQSALSTDSLTKKWTGQYYRYVDNKKDTNTSEILLIAVNNSKVYIDGSAIWIGNIKTGNVNVGQLQGIGEVKGSVLSEKVEGELCSAKITLTANNILLVDGESGCGGMNVTFNGEYRK